MFQQFTGKQYVKIDIASNFGFDKADWDVRLKWFDDNEHQLEKLVNQAEEPALFYAGVKAWRLCEAGAASGYPISLDATSSGLQILACLTGDRKAASICNVIDSGKREDAYTVIYHMMLEQVGEESKIKRSDTKQAVMTSLYGSQAIPKQVFGEGMLHNVFLSTMSAAAPAAWELNQAFLDIWNPEATEYNWTLPDNFHVKTKVMDIETTTVHFLNEPFDVSHKVNRATEQGRSLGANTVHSIDGMIVREMTRRCMYNPDKVRSLLRIANDLVEGYDASAKSLLPSDTEKDDEMVVILWDLYKKSGYLSARIIDHLHAHNFKIEYLAAVNELLNDLPAKPFELISIHDCFRCLPNYGNDLRRQYQLQLYYIARSDMLSFLLTQIMGRDVKVGKQDPTMFNDILHSNYALS